ncbi:hypothetical protein M218_13660 [Burkholderia pseudomallei MSHR338]|nr:hypothetical protein M218_13660 [Burkholderia pseudomallei MSHR338]
MWDGGGRFVGVAGVIGVIGAAGRGEPAGGEARGAVRVTRRIDVVILRSTPFGKSE